MKQKEFEQYTNNLVFGRTQGCINKGRGVLSSETKMRLDQNNQITEKL